MLLAHVKRLSGLRTRSEVEGWAKPQATYAALRKP